jgi:hypothetical protein
LIEQVRSRLKLNFLKKTPNQFYREFKFYRKLVDNRKYELQSNPNDPTGNKKLTRIDKLKKYKNENDCLKFAEALTIANDSNSKQIFEDFITTEEGTTSILQIDKSKIEFGLSDKKNYNNVKSISPEYQNKNAIPINGESYAIVNNEKAINPYHAAFVIYTHKGVNITLEAYDSTYDKILSDKTLELLPKFSFYDIENNGFTFHRCYAEDSSDKNETYKNGITIVLSSRINKNREFTINKYEGKKKSTLLKISPEVQGYVEPPEVTISPLQIQPFTSSSIETIPQHMETQSPTIQPLNKRPRTLTPQLTSQEEQPTKYLRRSSRITDKSPRSQIGGTKKKKTQKNTRKHKNK